MITHVVKDIILSDNSNLAASSSPTTKVRLLSIDFMRGFTVASMILVNSPGSWEFVYPWLSHASWNGCTFADLVFPFFLFIVGISIVFSLKSNNVSKVDQSQVFKKIFLRGAKLFALGLVLNFLSTLDLVNLRIPGVLQRIAIVFVVCASLFLITNWKQQLLISFILLIGYSMVLLFVPIPISGEVVLLPGNNIAAWVDSILLSGHMWSVTKVWDPEGFLSTFPAVVSGIFGLLVGAWISTDNDPIVKFKRLLISGIALMILGLALHFILPINKSLWTPSFVLFTSGSACLVFAIIYFIVDIKQLKIFTLPFVVYGTNAITAYLISEILTIVVYSISVNTGVSLKDWLFNQFQILPLGVYNISLLMAIGWVCLCYLPVWVLYKKRIFIKV